MFNTKKKILIIGAVVLALIVLILADKSYKEHVLNEAGPTEQVESPLNNDILE